jgi:hypothetical protein
VAALVAPPALASRARASAMRRSALNCSATDALSRSVTSYQGAQGHSAIRGLFTRVHVSQSLSAYFRR